MSKLASTMIDDTVFVEAIHLHSIFTATRTACGFPGKSMSWMEFKRGRITCPHCWDTAEAEDARSELRERGDYIAEPGTGGTLE